MWIIKRCNRLAHFGDYLQNIQHLRFIPQALDDSLWATPVTRIRVVSEGLLSPPQDMFDLMVPITVEYVGNTFVNIRLISFLILRNLKWFQEVIKLFPFNTSLAWLTPPRTRWRRPGCSRQWTWTVSRRIASSRRRDRPELLKFSKTIWLSRVTMVVRDYRVTGGCVPCLGWLWC